MIALQKTAGIKTELNSLFRFLYWGIALCACFLSIWSAGHWTRNLEMQRITKKANNALNVYVGDLQSELDKFEALPQILTANPLFIELLQNSEDNRLLDITNSELERINNLAETSAIYILDKNGKVITSSNWNRPVSFIGEDLAFRPYFKQAVKGGVGRYFALGTTSHVRGYYFAAPIYCVNSLVGVLIVKVQLQRFEDIWARGSEKIIVTDPQGVIFITSYASWKFRALYPLSKAVTKKLRKSRRYGDIEPNALTGTSIIMRHREKAQLELKENAVPPSSINGKHRYPYLIQSRNMPDAGWTVHILSDISYINDYVQSIMLLVTVCFITLLMACMLLYNRRKTRLERATLEKRAHQLLQKANVQLEHKVQNRTLELTKTNTRLHKEIEEHKQTETELLTTRDELIQAGKLAAIGQMAASITHEINQPLSAIQLYAENARIFLDQQQPDKARQNLTDIAHVIGKMAEITTHLKSFARKSPGNTTSVPLSGPITSALILLDMRVQKHDVIIRQNFATKNFFVLADPIRLEQVLVNVIGNAIDAVSSEQCREIRVEAQGDQEIVRLMICDSGSGIAVEHIDQIFDPFFTTKEEGKGLGLGLSLSLTIIRDFDGTIKVENHPQRGTTVTIELKRTKPLDGELL
jgi:two-component system C4-dicarboxylate transport sensor histidine kinase DctB